MHGCNWPDVPGISGPRATASHRCRSSSSPRSWEARRDAAGAAVHRHAYARFFALFRQEVAKKCDESARTGRAGTSLAPAPYAWTTASWMDRWPGHLVATRRSITPSPARSTRSLPPPTASPSWMSWCSARRVSLESCARRFGLISPNASHCAGLPGKPRFGRDDDCADRRRAPDRKGYSPRSMRPAGAARQRR